LTYVINFISTYFFLYPVITPEQYTSVPSIIVAAIQFFGGAFISLVYINYIHRYVFKKYNPSIKDCGAYLVISLISILITSGYLLYLLDSIQTPTL
jgi:hypothetical protein